MTSSGTNSGRIFQSQIYIYINFVSHKGQSAICNSAYINVQGIGVVTIDPNGGLYPGALAELA